MCGMLVNRERTMLEAVLGLGSILRWGDAIDFDSEVESDVGSGISQTYQCTPLVQPVEALGCIFRSEPLLHHRVDQADSQSQPFLLIA